MSGPRQPHGQHQPLEQQGTAPTSTPLDARTGSQGFETGAGTVGAVARHDDARSGADR